MSFPSCNSSYNLPRLLSHSHCLSIRMVNWHGTSSITVPEDDSFSRVFIGRTLREPRASFFLLNYILDSASALREGLAETSISKASHAAYIRDESRMFAVRFLSCRLIRKVRCAAGNNADSLATSELRNGNGIVIQIDCA